MKIDFAQQKYYNENPGRMAGVFCLMVNWVVAAFEGLFFGSAQNDGSTLARLRSLDSAPLLARHYFNCLAAGGLFCF